MAHLHVLLNCGIRCGKPAWAQAGYCTLNRIPISMGTSLLGGGGRARPGCLLGAIEALLEQANAHILSGYPNPDGATSFFVNLADTDAMARVQDGEAQGLAQAGITAIDFMAGQVRYADGHSDALTAQLLTGETSGVKLTKVYEMVDGQQVDLHAGDVLESEGYQGQDADGAIRQQTFAHEAVRTGDWEGTAEQEIKTDLLDGCLYLFRKDACLDLAASANDFEWRDAA